MCLEGMEEDLPRRVQGCCCCCCCCCCGGDVGMGSNFEAVLVLLSYSSV